MKDKDLAAGNETSVLERISRHLTDGLCIGSFKENVVVQFWEMVVPFKGKQKESATSFPASADVPAIAEPIAGQVHQRCIRKGFSYRWS